MARHDATGRSTGRAKKTRFNSIKVAFAWRPIEMLASPAMAALSLAGRRVLDRIEIELHHHGGNDNGRLPVTFDDFQRFGMDRHSIAPAVREVVTLGFIEITRPGRAGNGEHRTPTLYRLTYRHTEHGDPTDEWKAIVCPDAAKALAKDARDASPRPSNSRRAVFRSALTAPGTPEI